MYRNAALHILFAAALTAFACEARPAVFTVLSESDSGANTLRQAILDANAAPGPHTIEFDPAVQAIALATPLPAIAQDGVLVLGAGGVTLDGSALGAGHGIVLAAGNGEVSGFTIVDFPGSGVLLSGNGNRVFNCIIGTDGTFARSNQNGILVAGDSNLIGNNIAGGRNVIAGNSEAGIRIEDDGAGNVIVGNYIGLNPAGTAAQPNNVGIEMPSHTGTIIGGPAAGDGNVIAGNALDGISGAGNSGLVIQGNRIGVNAAGNAALPNGDAGIDLEVDATTTTVVIGGAEPGTGNLVSGNLGNGIRIQDLAGGPAPGRFIFIGGNIVGLNADRNAVLANTGAGIFAAAPGIVVGGPGTGNIVSGNQGAGIRLQNADGGIVQGNIVGTSQNGGDTELGNGEQGIRLDDTEGALVGGFEPGEANTVCFNAAGIVAIFGTSFDNAFYSNSVYGNFGDGIAATNGAHADAVVPSFAGYDVGYALRGTAAPGAIVQFFADDQDEGRTFIESVVANGADGAFVSIADLSAYAGRNITATGTVPGGSTSPFSDAVSAPRRHNADQNADGLISLSELLRVIQFYNSGGYSCDVPDTGSEDGFLPGAGDQSCAPHASDYNVQDWGISLSELLRLIQFYNAGGLRPCDTGEDGYCPGPL